MSDDLSHRAYRSHETIARTGQPRPAAPASDPLAELARLIGQTDPFADAEQASDRMMDEARAPVAPAAAPVSEWSMPEPAPAAGAAYETAPQPAGLYEVDPVPAYLTARASVDHTVYDVPEAGFSSGERDVYDDVPAPRRRMAMLVAVIALAVGGSAFAYAFHAMFGARGVQPPPVIHADNTPSKIVPTGQAKDGAKLITERVGNAGEKIVAREEKPVDITDKIVQPANTVPPAPAPMVAPPQASAGNGVIGSEPRKVHTIIIRPEGEQAAGPTPAAPLATAPAATGTSPPTPAPTKTADAAPPPAAPAPKPQATQPAPAVPPMPEARPTRAAPAAHTAQTARANAPLSLSPDSPAPARPQTRLASVAPNALAPAAAASAAKGAYAVQVSSQRTEQEAQAAFRALQGKYPKQLGGKPMFVHKVELGAKGTYYRALVGPFASASDASSLCASLKSAGGSCFIQRN